MGRKRIYQWEDYAATLDTDLPTSIEQGWSIHTVQAYLGLPTARHAHTALYWTRMLYRAASWALVSSWGPDAVYWWTDDPVEIRRYTRIRSKDLRARMRSTYREAKKAVAVTDGRSNEGKIAREIEMTLRHLEERIDNLLANA
jgi:hypothetical protein